jgi:hypothetical protein
VAAAGSREPIVLVALQQIEVVGQAVSLEPADDRLELGEGHLCPWLAEAVAQDRVVGVVVARRPAGADRQSLVLDHLGRHHLADALAQPVLGDGGRLDGRSGIALLGAGRRDQVWPRRHLLEPDSQRVGPQRHDSEGVRLQVLVALKRQLDMPPAPLLGRLRALRGGELQGGYAREASGLAVETHRQAADLLHRCSQALSNHSIYTHAYCPGCRRAGMSPNGSRFPPEWAFPARF